MPKSRPWMSGLAFAVPRQERGRERSLPGKETLQPAGVLPYLLSNMKYRRITKKDQKTAAREKANPMCPGCLGSGTDRRWIRMEVPEDRAEDPYMEAIDQSLALDAPVVGKPEAVAGELVSRFFLSPEQELLLYEEKCIVDRVNRSLTPIQQTAFLARYWEQSTQETVAKAYGVHQSTVSRAFSDAIGLFWAALPDDTRNEVEDSYRCWKRWAVRNGILGDTGAVRRTPVGRRHRVECHPVATNGRLA